MEPKIYLITGVMASGKSTTAELLARKYPRAVHLRGDIFRKMIVSGREEMAENPSDEAVRQLHLRYELAAGAARRYWEAGFTVVLQDNYYGEEWPRMLERFKGLPLRAVVLPSGWWKRGSGRGPRPATPGLRSGASGRGLWNRRPGRASGWTTGR